MDEKLSILDMVAKINQFSKITTSYNGGRPQLKCSRLVGNTNYAIALQKTGSYYVPSSLLKEDIRNFGKDQSQVLAIWVKEKTEEKYQQVYYQAKGIDANAIDYPMAIKSKICLTE